MSSTVTAASWANPGSSGEWTDQTQWSPASVPGAGANVTVGSLVSAPAMPWTVTVAGSQVVNSLTLDMGSDGTLSVAGALAVTGDASLGSIGAATIHGATIDVGSGAALSVAGNTVATYTTFQVNGGTITTGGYADLDGDDVNVQNGVWNADTLWVGRFFTTAATVDTGGTLTATNEINVGYDGTGPDLSGAGEGTLKANGGGLVIAPRLDVVNGSQAIVDTSSAIVLGTAASVAGAIAIGADGTLALEAARVDANVVDDGVLTALVNPDAYTLSAGTGPDITGTLSGTGSVVVGGGYTLDVGNAGNFGGSITIESGGTLKLDAGGAPGGSIAMADGTLDLAGLAFGGGQALAYDATTGVLTVGGASLDVGTGLALSQFSDMQDGGTGTLLTEIACYAAGTRIATEQGEAAVESLQPGARVRTASGRIAPVRWVGRTTLDLGRQPHAVPVRIAAGAFAPGLPRRDLLVSGDHAIAVDGVLIPARRLVNGCTIRTDTTLAAVTYVHVELDRHDLLLAEGLAAESFLDTGNRGQFDDTAAQPAIGMDREAESLRIFAERGCAPLVLEVPEPARRHLRERAEHLGWRLAAEPDLALSADRGGMQVMTVGPDALRLIVPGGVRALRLRSRRFVPAALDAAIPDGRTLGVALAVTIDGQAPDEATFGAGWYPPDAGAHWRWTDGNATLTLPGGEWPCIITLHILEAGARYWVQDKAEARAAA